MAALVGSSGTESGLSQRTPVFRQAAHGIALSQQDIHFAGTQLCCCLDGSRPESQRAFGKSFLTEPEAVAIIIEQFYGGSGLAAEEKDGGAC